MNITTMQAHRLRAQVRRASLKLDAMQVQRTRQAHAVRGTSPSTVRKRAQLFNAAERLRLRQAQSWAFYMSADAAYEEVRRG